MDRGLAGQVRGFTARTEWRALPIHDGAHPFDFAPAFGQLRRGEQGRLWRALPLRERGCQRP